MQSGSYVGVLRRWWFTLMAATVVGALAGWLVAGSLPESHRTEMRLLVGPVNADFDTLRAASELTRTYADLATSSEVLNAAIASGGLSTSLETLRDGVRSIPNEQTRILTLSVELPAADEAVRVTEAVAQSLIAYAAAGAVRPEGELRVIDQATPPVPAAPARTALAVLLAALGALLGALLLVILIEWLDSTLRDVGQVRRIAGTTFARTIPISGGAIDASAVAASGEYVELLGDVSAALGRTPRSLFIASVDGAPDADEVAIRLAAAAESLGVSAVVDVDAHPDEDPYAVLEHLRQQADLAIVSGGSIVGNFGAPAWTRLTDRAILVARVGRSRAGELRAGIDRLAAVSGARVVVVAATANLRRVRAGRRSPAVEALAAGEAANSGASIPAGPGGPGGPDQPRQLDGDADPEAYDDPGTPVRAGGSPRGRRSRRGRHNLGRQMP